MDGLRAWMLGVVCAAMVVALAGCLLPKGTVRKIGGLTGALVLLLAILQPLADWREIDISKLLEQYGEEVEPYSGSLELENENLMKEIIAEKTGAYILDKAAELGFSCKVRVEVRPDESGTPLPWSAEIISGCTPGQQDALTRVITQDLDIPVERQTYRREEVQ